MAPLGSVCFQLAALFLAQAPAAAPQAVSAPAAAGGVPFRPLGYDLTSVFVFTMFGIAFVVITVSLLSRLLRPYARPADEPAKEETYECGEPAIGSSWVRFDIRFYMVALIFLIFDVEVAFLYPWAVLFKQLRTGSMGTFIFLEMFLFIGILLVGYIYCWRKGDLDWVKSVEEHEGAASIPPPDLLAKAAPDAGGSRKESSDRQPALPAGAGRSMS